MSLSTKFKINQVWFRIIWIAVILAGFFLAFNSLLTSSFVGFMTGLVIGLGLFVTFLIFEIREHVAFTVREFYYTVKTLKPTFASIVIFDTLFYVAAFSVFLYSWYKLSDLLVAFQEAIQQLPAKEVPEARNLAIGGLAIIVGLFLALIVLWSLLKGSVWIITRGRQFTWQFYLRFAGVSLVWFFAWYVLFNILGFILAENVVAIFALLAIPLFIYMTFFVYTCLDTKIFLDIGEGVSKSIKLLPKFVFPFVFIVLLYFTIAMLLSPLSAWNPRVNAITVIIVSLVYFNLVRIYMVRLIRKLAF
mgnify:CR=1 FL=1